MKRCLLSVMVLVVGTIDASSADWPQGSGANGDFRVTDPAPVKWSVARDENAMKNARGFVVMGDKRSQGNGWGHVAAPTPSVAGSHLYVPVQNGTVYVMRWDAEKLDENAIVAINDLGPAGHAYTRASVTFFDGKAYAHTIRELICIGQ